MASEGFVTYRELSECQDNIKRDLIENQESVKKDVMEHVERGDKRVDRLDIKMNNIDEKVNQLNDLVLPLTVAMKQTAENTKDMSDSLKQFTKNQSDTNGIFYEKFNAQAISIESIKNITNNITDKKKYNVSVVVAIIGLVGIFITGLFQLAPMIFN